MFLTYSYQRIGVMAKRSFLMWSVISFVSLLVLTQSASADLMKIEFDISTCLSIPVNRLTIESITTEYWLTSEALFKSDRLETFEQRISQMVVFNKESLTLSFDVLMKPFSRDTDLLSTSLYETTFYTPITDIGSKSFRETASFPSYDLSNMIGKKNILDSNLWH